MGLDTLSESRTFGGTIGTYRHEATSLDCPMRFSVFRPPAADDGPVPILWWLSGLTCTEENFAVKAGAYRAASRLGLMIVAPDTSPRGDDVADDPDYDLGQGAGFYVNATEEPWARHYRMYEYISRELQETVGTNFPVDTDRQGIFGHSMGGHGALVIGLRNPETYKSISAFAPIVSAMHCPWGEKALRAYLGPNRDDWAEWDACALMAGGGNRSGFPEILVDQGLGDDFLVTQLKPHLFQKACRDVDQTLRLREHEGYDHSYFFIATFIEDHLNHHFAILNG